MTYVTSALAAPANFTPVEIGGSHINIEGEADSSFTVVSVAIVLEALGRFSEVRIVRIDDTAAGSGNSGVSFVISVS